MADWMIYGATGYTGILVAEEAVKRGHKPLLAGRSEAKLKRLGERLGLEYAVIDINDGEGLKKAVSRVGLVYHAAGPFIQTGKQMMQACLAAGAHYLDINGEIPLYQYAFSCDSAAREKGIAFLPGIGFDVIPSDCLVKYVADQLPDATHLEIALDILSTSAGGTGNLTAGTAKSTIDLIATTGNLLRRDGKLEQTRFGVGARSVRFANGEKAVLQMTWGDLEMGYRTTGIPNITTSLTFAPVMINIIRLSGWALPTLLKPNFIRDFLGRQIERRITGPSESARETGHSYVYTAVRNAKGETRQAWLETPEAYQFTAVAGLRVVERLLDGQYKGTFTPSQALGADFVLEIEGTKRWDSLPS